MRIAIVYVFPNLMLNRYVPMARRFTSTYLENPPGASLPQVHVVVNGPAINEEQRSLFDGLKSEFHQHNNEGKDIGAFKMMSDALDCDLLVCLGSHVYFPSPGWLDVMVDAYLKHGPGLYGCWGFTRPTPHIRTTAFWLPPDLLSAYPYPITNSTRYKFEFGRQHSILQWTKQCGLPIAMVTWKQTRLYPDFDHVEPQDCIVLDQHTDRLRDIERINAKKGK